jgi:SpoIIAA-like
MADIMLKLLSDFPDDVLAVEGHGEVTAEDYKSVLIPAALAKIGRHKSLRILCILGPGFTGMSAGAMWQDTKLGIGHWGDWGRMAVVTDIRWIQDGVRMFAPLFHHPLRVFDNKEVDAAKAWIAEKEAAAA